MGEIYLSPWPKVARKTVPEHRRKRVIELLSAGLRAEAIAEMVPVSTSYINKQKALQKQKAEMLKCVM